MNSKFLSVMSEHLFKRIEQVRIAYPKSGLQDSLLSEGEHQNSGGPMSSNNCSGHIQNNIILFPARS